MLELAGAEADEEIRESKSNPKQRYVEIPF
jgi:hypothetical protein